jgi:hypothetical protein
MTKKKRRMSDEKIMSISQVLTLNRVLSRLLESKGISEDDILNLCEQAMEPEGLSLFMVRDKKTGLFSTGGWDLRMLPVGKVWFSLSDVRSHFQMIGRGDRYHPATRVSDDWEVVRFQMVEVGRPTPARKALK